MAGYYLNFTCFDCNQKSLSINGKENDINSYIIKNYDMAGITQVNCPKCNKKIVIVNQCLQFEIYLQCAIERFLDGDNASSVFLLAKAQETFISFVIELLFYEQNKEIKLKKFGLGLSERMKGLFAGLCFYRFNEMISFDSKYDEIRNNVIHKDIFPNKTDTIKYGEYILLFIYDIVEKIKSNIPLDIYMKYIQYDKQYKLNTCLKHLKDENVSIQAVSDVMDLFSRNSKLTFQTLCNIIKQNNDMLNTHSKVYNTLTDSDC